VPKEGISDKNEGDYDKQADEDGPRHTFSLLRRRPQLLEQLVASTPDDFWNSEEINPPLPLLAHCHRSKHGVCILCPFFSRAKASVSALPLDLQTSLS
jgi:hypothetical protein